MLPAVALVGRPNVGKSTLFNRLTASRDALVADYPGLTRDRRYGIGRAADRKFIVIDTGGLVSGGGDAMTALVAEQVAIALEEADAVVLVVDHRSGLTAEDTAIAERLRRDSKPVVIAVNKAEGVPGELAEAEFHRLGLGAPVGISATHGQGVDALLRAALAPFPDSGDADPTAETEHGPKVAVIGRPNVGKSTLINRLLGENRLITSPEPGTTRDSIHVPVERDDQKFVLVDTAGIRRRARVSETVEKYSIVQSLKAIEEAGAVIAVLDARDNVTDQDVHLVGLAAERGRALALAVNKWDGMSGHERRFVEREVEQADFVQYASALRPALHGAASPSSSAALSATERRRRAATPRLTRVLEDARRTRRRSSAAAAAALCASGRTLSASDRRARHAGAAPARSLQALPRERVSRSVEAEGHAGARRAAHDGESVRGPAQQNDAAAGEKPPAHAALQAQEVT
jgi:GTP-binding protein